MRMQAAESQVKKKKAGVKSAKAAIKRLAKKHSGTSIPVPEIREEVGAKVRATAKKKQSPKKMAKSVQSQTQRSKKGTMQRASLH